MAVLGTKLHVPAPRRRLVPRPRLTGLVTAGGPLPRLVLVSAPAGFGKTTLLAQWLTGETSPVGRVAWLSLDEADNDVRRFLAHLVASLQQAGVRSGGEVEALLETPGELPAEAILTALVNAVDPASGATVVALDDYHVIGAPTVHDAVTFLVEHLPDGAGLAIATRSDPPWSLARLRSRGDLLELRAADLRFTADEADWLLNRVMGLDLTTDQVSALDARTEGWAAGLQLAALSLRSHDDAGAFIAAFAGSHRFVLDYLVEEVLRSRPDRERRFLLQTSVLDRLTGPLCDALSGSDDGSTVLESLERANLFVVPLDDTRTWYRYHHLFAEALRARLSAEDPGRVPALHRAASRWYAGRGLVEEAIGHAVAGDDPEQAADLVEHALPEYRRQRRDRTLRRWLDALPDDRVRARPLLAVQRGWSRLVAGDLAGLEAWLRDAEHSLAAAPGTGRGSRALAAEYRTLPAWIAIYRASAAQARGDAAGTAQHARHARRLAGPDDHLARAGAAGFLGLSAWASGDLVAAVDTFAEAVAAMHAGGHLTDELGSTVVLADLWVTRGRPQVARGLLEQALADADRDPVTAHPVAGDLHVSLGDVLREQGDLPGADRHLERSRELGDAASLMENRHRWFVASAGLLRARGDLDGAVELLDEAAEHYVRGFFPEVRPVPALRARVRIAQGDLAEASRWAERSGVTADDTSYLSECNRLTLARLLVARTRAHGDRRAARDALAMLAPALTEARASGRGRSEAEIRMLQALAHHALGEPDRALTALARSLSGAVPAGFARLFLDEGEPMVELLGRMSSTGAAEHARRLLDTGRRAAGAAPAPPSAPDREPLSERELEVLRMLATELSGPELARRLFVSVNTLRTHTRHIFTKLDVNTRRAAVRRAGELGLL